MDSCFALILTDFCDGQGNSKSKPLDISRVSEIATEACGAFSKEFPLAYRDCVVDSVKLQKNPKPNDQALLSAPLPTQVIKCGELFKQGEINTSWKKRYFTALNRADNFAITYSEDSNAATKKGRINCFG